MKRTCAILLLLVFALTGCRPILHSSGPLGQPSPEVTQTPASQTPEPTEVSAATEPPEELFRMGVIPALPVSGTVLEDFVCENWFLLDSVTLDFNGDGADDYVGVLERSGEETLWYPRILFALRSEQDGALSLDFQDIHLIRTALEGGKYDAYQPLTAEGGSFTTHEDGGGQWGWNEAFTYTYQEGQWVLERSERSERFVSYLTHWDIDDYQTGIGIRHRNRCDTEFLSSLAESDDFPENETFDLTYEVALDPMPTLYQTSQRGFWVGDRIGALSYDHVTAAEGIELPPGFCWSEKSPYFSYIDENTILDTFRLDPDSPFFMVVYDRNTRALHVAAQFEDGGMDSAKMYKGMIYYSRNLPKDPAAQSAPTRLMRMNPDGTGVQVVFETQNVPAEGQSFEFLTHPILNYEITGDEILVEVYLDKQPHPIYRMGLDGSDLQLIGTLTGTLN